MKPRHRTITVRSTTIETHDDDSVLLLELEALLEGAVRMTETGDEDMAVALINIALDRIRSQE